MTFISSSLNVDATYDLYLLKNIWFSIRILPKLNWIDFFKTINNFLGRYQNDLIWLRKVRMFPGVDVLKTSFRVERWIIPWKPDAHWIIKSFNIICKSHLYIFYVSYLRVYCRDSKFTAYLWKIDSSVIVHCWENVSALSLVAFSNAFLNSKDISSVP